MKEVIFVGKDTQDGLEVSQAELPRFVEDVFDQFRRLFMDWLKFYRQNMTCPCGLCLDSECPQFCPLEDEDCPELLRLWVLWFETLSLDDSSIFNNWLSGN